MPIPGKNVVRKVKKMKENAISTKEVIAFFDRCAPGWDKDMIRDEEVIGDILRAGGIKEGANVLDVACGTGVLMPDYLRCGVSAVLGVDISPGMISVAQEKFHDPRIRFVCDDIYTVDISESFDCIMVYNAFPHFGDPKGLIHRLAGLLSEGGTLTVAHGMSRERINHHHSGAASHVSQELMEADALARVFSEHLTVTKCLSDERMYLVTGRKTQ